MSRRLYPWNRIDRTEQNWCPHCRGLGYLPATMTSPPEPCDCTLTDGEEDDHD